jgi:hypothetical protein
VSIALCIPVVCGGGRAKIKTERWLCGDGNVSADQHAAASRGSCPKCLMNHWLDSKGLLAPTSTQCGFDRIGRQAFR